MEYDEMESDLEIEEIMILYKKWLNVQGHLILILILIHVSTHTVAQWKRPGLERVLFLVGV